MIRALLMVFLLMLVYSAAQDGVPFRASGHITRRTQEPVHGEEMVLDPRVPHLRDQGPGDDAAHQGQTLIYFCSEDCAKQYEDKTRT